MIHTYIIPGESLFFFFIFMILVNFVFFCRASAMSFQEATANELTELAVGWGAAGFEPGATALQSGAQLFSHRAFF